MGDNDENSLKEKQLQSSTSSNALGRYFPQCGKTKNSIYLTYKIFRVIILQSTHWFHEKSEFCARILIIFYHDLGTTLSFQALQRRDSLSTATETEQSFSNPLYDPTVLTEKRQKLVEKQAQENIYSPEPTETNKSENQRENPLYEVMVDITKEAQKTEIEDKNLSPEKLPSSQIEDDIYSEIEENRVVGDEKVCHYFWPMTCQVSQKICTVLQV